MADLVEALPNRALTLDEAQEIELQKMVEMVYPLDHEAAYRAGVNVDVEDGVTKCLLVLEDDSVFMISKLDGGWEHELLGENITKNGFREICEVLTELVASKSVIELLG